MTPIIDVHAHIFSAKDIPVEGYLLSREPAMLLEQILHLCGLRRVLIPIVSKCIRKEADRDEKKNLPSNSMCDLIMGLISMCMKHYREWARTLSKDIKGVTQELVGTYEKDGIDLWVPAMVDYEYWFKNTVDTPIEKQIRDIHQQIILPGEGRIHPFVAFDPARELAFRKHMLNPDRKPELFGSLDLVKDAIENKGFIGVKLYNAMGYKPFNNATVDGKRRKRIRLHKKMGYHVFKGEEYDQVLSELYDYCVENDVPITTHCGMYGIESYHNASFDFGQAVFWHEVLSQKRYENLRLNLAHFGWTQEHRYHGKKGWVKDICEMLIKYNCLFTDVSHHRVLSDKNRRKFKSDYEDMRDDWQKDWPHIKKRILFGTDWHVLKRVKGYEDFKKGYIEVLKHKSLFTDPEIEDFLGGNAVNFLGLLPGSKNRQRLEKFYDDNEIDHPEWFGRTAGLEPKPECS
ncbi:hypothetical protein AMJ44_09135 [candidate division WOR-1 bacterium DG_54_3]|uniref:Amidohydrolase-related domain-containing protein n=1 Tax=candidate division WOR-1 bacterium DG_54_3 TaxID=1703775 RepID=A0A0S7XU43_UNCSA|nr:MAG: hypothetical protein AMJ44_09135 [candidate division WOR-1 bacterium DG_54_3]